jgi:2-polyprenyl-3-methyl-5-hydroxy-6-metoxy-1,4-benzoquinol methylase
MTPVILKFSAPFVSLAEGEVRRSGLRNLRRLAPDTILADWPGHFDKLAQQWRYRPPIYIRHIHPVQSRPRPLGQVLRHPPPLLSEPFYPGRPSLYIYEDYAGVLQAHQQLTPWPWGIPHFTPDPGLINRAEWKLLEAIGSFGISLPAGTALDLGSSPGGWSRVLSRLGAAVAAVDPHPRGMEWSHPKLVHHPLTAQEFLRQTADSFDLIVNDMWLRAEESAEIMLAAAAHLRPGGQALMTLKLGHLCPTLESRRGPLRRSLNILRRVYRIPRMRQLFYNRNEVTVWLQRLPN